MIKVIEFKAIEGSTIDELNDNANQALADGFMPNSGISVCVCILEDGSKCLCYAQTMLKYGE